MGGVNIKKGKLLLMLACLILIILSFNMIYAQDFDDNETLLESGVNDGQYKIGISQETYIDDEIINKDNSDLGETKNECVERIIESSANDNNSSNNPQDTISLNSNINSSSSEIALNSNLGEEKLGAGNPSQYEADGNYEHTYDSSVANLISDEMKEYLKHFKYVSAGRAFTSSGNPAYLFWTPIINGKLDLICDIGTHHIRAQTKNLKGYTSISYSGNPTLYQSVSTGVDVVEFNGVSVGSNLGFELNRDGGSWLEVTGLNAYYTTSISLTINRNSAYTTDSITLTPTVLLYDGTTITQGTVKYYCDGVEFASGSAGSPLNFYPSTYDMSEGSHVIHAEYQEYAANHYFSSRSNDVSLTLTKHEPAVSLTVNGESDEVSVKYGDSINLASTTTGPTSGSLQLIVDSSNDGTLTLNGNRAYQTSGMTRGTHTFRLYYAETSEYRSAYSNTVTVNILTPSTVSANDITYDYGSTGSSSLSYTGASGVVARIYDSTGNTYIKDATVSGNTITVNGLNAGTYTLNVTTVPLQNYIAVSESRTITVNKINPVMEIIFNNVNSDNPTALYEGLFNLNYTHLINIGISITNDATGTVTYTFDDGNTQLYQDFSLTQNFDYQPKDITSSRDTTVTATYRGDTNYNSLTVTKQFHISRHIVDLSLSLDKTADLFVGDTIVITPTVTVDGNPITKGDKGRVVIQVNGESITAVNLNEKANYEYVLASNGEKRFTAVYLQNDYYESATTESEITTKVQAQTDLTISVSNVTYGSDSVATITTNAPGTYSYNIAGTTGTLTFTQAGSQTVSVKLDANDNYHAAVEIAESDYYTRASASTAFKVQKAGSDVEIPQFDDFRYGSEIEIAISDYENATGITAQMVGGDNSYISYDGFKISIKPGLAVGTYTLNVTTQTTGNYNPSYDTYTFNVLRVDTVWVSPDGSGLGVSSDNPTTWDNVADILTDNGTVIFTEGNYDDFYNKTISKPWTIIGDGNVVLNANYKYRIFEVFSENVTLSNLKFINGQVNGGGEGGAIYLHEANVKISDCDFENNIAENWGGAIAAYGENTNIFNCNFKNNTAHGGGGAIFAQSSGNINIFNCNFTDNINDGAGGGGAIFWNSNGIISNCNFINNSADVDGGAIYIYEDCTISKCNFTLNNAENGGAIYSYWGESSVDECDFTLNNATQNGGAINWRYDNGKLSNSNFTENKANCGGAIYWTGANGEISKSVFTDNEAESDRHIHAENTDVTLTESKLQTIIEIEQVSDCPYNSTAVINGTFDDGTNLDICTLKLMNNEVEVTDLTVDSNTFSYTWNNLEVGEYSITLDISDDNANTYTASYDPLTFRVYRANSSVSINPIRDVYYNNTVTVSYSVENATTITYIVKSRDGKSVAVVNTTISDIHAKTLKLPLLDVGEYTITIANAANENFTGSAASADFSIKNGTIETLTVTVDHVKYPNRAHAVVTASVDGEYIVTVNNKNYTVTVYQGRGESENFEILGVDEYDVNVTSNIPNYNIKKAHTTFKVTPAGSSVVVPEKTFAYAVPVEITVTTVNSTGNVKATLTYVNGTPVTEGITVSGNKITITGLKVGNYTLTVTTNVDGNHSENTSSGSLKIIKSDDSGFNVNATPRVFDYQKSTVLIPTFKYPVKGNVTFTFDDGTNPVTIKVGENYTYTPKYAGKHNVIAVYSGDDSFNTATRDHVNITVNRLDPNFRLDDGNQFDITFGDSVIIKTVVDDKYKNLVTGNVTIFFSNGTNKTVKIGESVTYTPFKAGDRTVRAIYTGDVNFIGGNDEFTIHVKKSHNSGFIANVTPGTINFEDSAVVLGNVTNPHATGNVTYRLPNGTVETLPVGTPYTVTPTSTDDYHIIVDYSGDDNYNDDSVELILKVNKIDAGFNASANQTIIVFEGSVKLNSSVLNPKATGNVTYRFDDGTLRQSDKSLTDIITYTPQTAGLRNVTVIYSGDKNFNQTTKVIQIMVLKSDNSGFNCIPVPDEINLGQSSRLVSNATNPKATGTVTYRFDDGTAVVVRTDAASWNCTYVPLSAGQRVVNVTYSGDENFNERSFNVYIKVNKISAGFDAFTLRNSTVYLDNVTLYHRFSDNRATGNVTFYLTNGTNVTVMVGETLKFVPTYAGEHVITVKYSGDGNFSEATDTVKFNITKSNDSGFNVEVNPRILTYLNSTTLKGTLKNGAAGNVTFIFDDGTPSVTVNISEVYTYTPKWAGKHNITAIYNGDGNFNENTRKINITVNRIDPNFRLDDGGITDLTFGQNVTIRTVVDERYRDFVTGNVTIYFSNGTNKTVKIGESVNYKPYKAGDRIVRAEYTGDGNFIGGEDHFTIHVKKSDDTGFMANVTPGIINLKDNAIVLGNVTNSNATGNVTYVLPDGSEEVRPVGTPLTVIPSAAGTYHIVVKYSGDDNYNGHPGIDVTLKVNKIDAGFNVSSNETVIVYGNGVKLNASVLDPLATGTVDYRFDAGAPAQLNHNITDIINYIPREAGVRTVTITYSGDSNFNNATKVINIVVLKSDASGFNCIPNPDEINLDQSSNLTSTVSNPNATGNVTYRFDDGTQTIVRLTKDVWNYIYKPLSAGTRVVNVTYSGDKNFNGTSFNVYIKVNKISAGFDAYTLRNSTVYLDNVTLYNKVSDSRATGNVTYCLTNGTNVTVKVGETLKFVPTYAGEHVITVKYSGDGNFTGATDTIKFNITKSDKSQFDANANPKSFWFELNTTINSTIGNGATGNVTYVFDDGTESVNKNIGEAFVYVPKTAGKHIINATYNGDGNFNKQTVMIEINVREIGAGFHIHANRTTIIYGDKVLINSDTLNPVATGTVTYFFDDKTNITYDLGQSFVYFPLSAGTHVINATYSGDDNFAPENDTLTITVRKSDNTGFMANITPGVIDFEDSVVIFGNVTNPDATGNVTYVLPNGTDVIRPVGTPYTAIPSAAGNYHIIVKYSGDDNYNGHDGIELTLVVNRIDVGFNASSNATVIVFGDSVKLNASVLDPLATGTVDYRFDAGAPAQLNHNITDIITYTPRQAGMRNVTVYYSGDNNFKNATKVIQILVLKSDKSGFECNPTPDEINLDQSSNLTSTVSNPKATGNVTYRFDDGTQTIVRLNKDGWNYIYKPLSAGIRVVNVTYSGDENFNGTSFNVYIKVNKISAGFDAYTLRNSTVYLDNVTLYNKVSDSRATGNVTYYLTNGTNVTVKVGETVKFVPTYAGEHVITVKYSGDGNFTGATDTIKFNITKSDNSRFYVEVDPRIISYLGNTKLKGTLTNGASGNVTFIFDDGTPSVTVNITQVVVYTPKWAGKHNITAIYNGDTNFNENTHRINITVNRINPNFRLDDGGVTDLTFGQNVTVKTVVDDKYKNLVTGNVTIYFSNGTNITVKIGESVNYKPYIAGDRVVRAEYTGDGNFIGGEDHFTIHVKKSDDAGFIANITPGIIDFEGSAVVLGNVTNSNATGNVTYHLPNGTDVIRPVGTPYTVTPDSTDDYHITVDYSGDDNYNGKTGIEIILKVNKIDAGFKSSANETEIIFEQSIKINSSVTNPKATGNVTYRFDDGTFTVLDKAIGDVIIYTPRSAGEHNITVIYSGDKNFNGTVKIITVKVEKSDNSGFICIAQSNEISLYQSTRLLSSVSNPKATGNVTYIFDDGTSIVIKTTKATWNTTYTPKFAGKRVVNVTYSGDENFRGTTLRVNITVNKISAGFDAYTLRNSTVYLDNVTLYNKVSDSRATGNVTYYLTNGTNVTVKVGETLKFVPTYAGEHVITVKYSGDGNFSNATDTIKFNITKSSDSGFYVKVNPRILSYLNSTTLKGTLKNGATGNVTFIFDDGTPSVTVNITELVVYTPKWAGKHNITAIYNGDNNFTDNKRIINITVNQISAGFHLGADKTEITFEESVILSNIINNKNATGNVTLFFDDKTNKTINLNETFTYTPKAGRHIVHATYSGDRNFKPETDTGLVIFVAQSTNSGFNASAEPEVIPFENTTVLNSTLANPNATGNVTYHFENGTNITVPVGTPVPFTPNGTGTYTINVTYGGDDNFKGDEKIITVTVNPIDAKFNATVDNKTPTYNEAIHLNSTLSDNLATGNVTYIFDDGTPNIEAKIGEVIEYIPQTAGNHTIIARYTGDKNFNGDEIKINITVAKAVIDVNVTVINPTYPKNATVIVNASVDGEYNVTVNGTVYKVKVENGTGNVTIDQLPAGEYPVNVTADIPNYNPVDETDSLTVSNGTISVTVDVPQVKYPENITVFVNATVDGNYTVKVGDKNYTVTVTNGTGNVTIDKLPAGDYPVNVTANITNYNPIEIVKNAQIGNGTLDFNITVVNATYPETAKVIVNATVDGNYTLTVDGQNYTVVVEKGSGSIQINQLPAGEYPVKVTSNVTNYDTLTKQDTIGIKNGTINVNVTVINATYPKQGKVIVNASVDGTYNVEVDGKVYPVHVVDGNGSATIDKLPSGEYQVNVTANIPNYNPVEKTDNLAVSNGTIEMNVTVKPATYPENATVIVNSTVDGNFTVQVGNKTYNVTVTNGTGNVTIDKLPSGNHTVNVTSNIPNYNQTSKTDNIIVNNGTIDMNITVVDSTYPDTGKVIITSNVDGNYTVNVNGTDYHVEVIGGTGEAIIDKLPVGNYPVNVTSNIDNYDVSRKNDTLHVKPGEVSFDVEVKPVKYPENATIIVKSDVDGNFTVNVDNRTYTVTVENGTGNVTIDQLDVGKYPVNVTSDIPNYSNITKNANVEVNNGPVDMNVTVIPTTYPENATVVVNSTVDGNYTVTVDNKTYTVTVVNGTGNVTIDTLPAGNHTVNVTSNIPDYENTTVISEVEISNGKVDFNVTVDNPTYPDRPKVTITSDVDGEYIVEVNNKRYVTNVVNGTSTVEIDQLPAGNYHVKVTPNIANYESNAKESSLTVKPAKTQSNVKLKVTLRDNNGKVLSNAKVTFTYNGKTYTVKTNKKGIATITVKKSSLTTNAAVKVKKVNGKKVSSKVSKLKYSATFKDKNGKLIVGKKVTFKFNGKVYKVKTNKKGVATLKLKKVKAGKYRIVAKYKNIVHRATVKIK